jgi:hypothetical protein
MIKVISQDPRRAEQMGKAMSFLDSSPGENVQYMLENFAWGAAVQGLLVDVGGAKGTVAMAIARYQRD